MYGAVPQEHNIMLCLPVLNQFISLLLHGQCVFTHLVDLVLIHSLSLSLQALGPSISDRWQTFPIVFCRLGLLNSCYKVSRYLLSVLQRFIFTFDFQLQFDDLLVLTLDLCGKIGLLKDDSDSLRGSLLGAVSLKTIAT